MQDPNEQNIRLNVILPDSGEIDFDNPVVQKENDKISTNDTDIYPIDFDDDDIPARGPRDEDCVH